MSADIMTPNTVINKLKDEISDASNNSSNRYISFANKKRFFCHISLTPFPFTCIILKFSSVCNVRMRIFVFLRTEFYNLIDFSAFLW